MLAMFVSVVVVDVFTLEDDDVIRLETNVEVVTFSYVEVELI